MNPNFGKNLGNSDSMTPDERRAEADRVIQILNEFCDWCSLTDKESEFVHQMDDVAQPVSQKQLRWLRDIKAKYCE